MTQSIDDTICELIPNTARRFAASKFAPKLDPNVELGKLDLLVLTALSEDIATYDLAKNLTYSEHTINAIAQCAAKKLGCNSITGAVAKAIRLGLV